MLNKSLRILWYILPLVMLACHDDDNDPDIDACITAKSDHAGKVIAGEYIVSFQRPGSDKNGRTAARVFERHNIAPLNIIAAAEGERSNYIVRLSLQEAGELRNDAAVVSIEPDRVISVCGCFSVLEPRLITWNINKVGYGDGTGKTAWVMDTGIDYDHPDLIVDLGRSRSFLDGIATADDDHGHGTHIGGVIGARNNTIGTLGVASGATLVALKILDSKGDGRLSAALRALSYIRSNGKAGDVVNISMELKEISETLETEIQGVANRGMFVTIAAGNDGTDASAFSPARTSGKNIYTVSAVDSLNRFASFSNYGREVVDFAAPGVKVLSSLINGKYGYMSGTSMAAPHVAGLLLINNGIVNAQGSAINDPDGVPDPLAHQ